VAVTYTYDDNALREDLLDLITNLDYKEFQLISGLGVSDADSTRHEWLTDTLATAGTNAKVEGAATSFGTRTNPQRLFNYTQIIETNYSVSDTERATNNAGFNDRFSYEATKAMKEWKQDAEYALVRGSLICGTGSAARQLKGIKQWLVNNNYTAQSGVSLTETMLNDYLEQVWEDGTEVNAIYAPMYLKRKISGFTGGSTKNVDAVDRRLVNAVDIYQADAATNVKLFAHRYVTVSGDTNKDLIGINEDMFKVAYLRKPKTEDRAKTGDSTDAVVIGEITLECYHEDAGFHTAGIL
jgi:hypothetical protein